MTDRPRRIRKTTIDREYQEKILEAGRFILSEAHVPEFLSELAEVIQPEFPDVKINEAQLFADGSVGLRIDWNFRRVRCEVDPSHPVARLAEFVDVHDTISVNAEPLTEDLAITGGIEQEVLWSKEWRSDPRLLEDAIIRAYQNPMRAHDIPVRA